MMKIKYFAIIVLGLLIGLAASQPVSAQKKKTQLADQAFEDKQYFAAIDKYKKAYSKAKKNKAEKSRIAYQIAECYRFTNETKRAEAAYKRAIRMKHHRKEPLAVLYYADALKTNGKYNLAIEQYNEYAERVSNDPRGPEGANSCRLALKWKDLPSKYEVENIKKINSKVDDFAPSYADKFYNSIIFTSAREGSTGKDTDDWTGQNFSDLFFAKMDRKKTWNNPVLLDESEVVNTVANEGVSTLNSTFSKMYFTRCGNVKGEKKGCQIYTSTRRGKSMGAPQMLILGSDTNATVGHPTLSKDEKMIIFSSDKGDGYGGKDLYMATRKDKESDFRLIRNLGPVINTMGDEMFPFLRDDTVLYFASDRLPGMGGLDIFKSSYVDEKWSKPVNLKPPINSSNDDFAIVFKAGKESGLFSTNRKGGRGGDDIWSFIEPPVEFTLSGVVKDDMTLQYIIGADIKLIGSNGSSITAKSDPKGYFNFGKTQLKPFTSYEIIVSKEDYFNITGRITTVDVNVSMDFVYDFLLQPIPDEAIVLPEILYDLDKWNLKPQYQDSLQGLIQTLGQNPTIIVELASHTDTRADDNYNDILSQKRAESVIYYLIDRGIDPDRLVAKGYGERIPRTINKDMTRENFTFKKGTILSENYIASLPNDNMKEAAHQLNRRTDFRVISRDFVPKATIEEIASEAEIDIIINPEKNAIPFTQGKGEAVMSTCIINGYNMEFTYVKRVRGFNISIDEALRLLKEGAISKNDFEGDINKVLAEGTISDRAVFYLNEVRIGDNVVNDISATVIHDMEEQVMFGEATLKMFGKFTIDYDKKEIVFE